MLPLPPKEQSARRALITSTELIGSSVNKQRQSPPPLRGRRSDIFTTAARFSLNIYVRISSAFTVVPGMAHIFDLKTDIYQEARSDTIGTETGDGGDNWKNNSAQEELRRTLARAGGGQG